MRVEIKVSGDVKEPYAVIFTGNVTEEIRQAAASLETRETVITANDRERIIVLSPEEVCMVDVYKRQELAKIDELIADGGEVQAEVDGVITKMGVVPGTSTTGTEIVEIGTGTYQFVGTLYESALELVQEGDSIDVTLPQQKGPVKAQISSSDRFSWGCRREGTRFRVRTFPTSNRTDYNDVIIPVSYTHLYSVVLI